MFVVVEFKQLYQIPINNLDLSISLRMERSGILQLGIHSLQKHCQKFVQETTILVGYDGG